MKIYRRAFRSVPSERLKSDSELRLAGFKLLVHTRAAASPPYTALTLTGSLHDHHNILSILLALVLAKACGTVLIAKQVLGTRKKRATLMAGGRGSRLALPCVQYFRAGGTGTEVRSVQDCALQPFAEKIEQPYFSSLFVHVCSTEYGMTL